MFKIKATIINNMNFISALTHLAGSQGLNFPSSYNISKIHSKVEMEAKALHNLYKGQFKDLIDENNQPLPEQKDAYEAKMKEFLETEIEIHRNLIKLTELINVKTLTPLMLSHLEPIIEDDFDAPKLSAVPSPE